MCRRSDPSLAETLHMRVESGARHVLGQDWSNCLMFAAGPEPFALVDRAMALAGRLSGGLSSQQHVLVQIAAAVCKRPCETYGQGSGCHSG